jgi:rhodanese-related sulfurtransferase
VSLFSRLFGSARAAVVRPVQAHDLVRAGALLVDVREQGEWDAGHAPKAKHHPLGGLALAMAGLPADRTIVVVCRSGNRSARAARMLAKAGFDARDLLGGMHAWAAAGLPVVSSRGRKGSVA